MSGQKSKRRAVGPAIPRLDAMVVTGIGSLLNTDHINPDVNLNSAEEEITGRSNRAVTHATINPVDSFKKDLSALSQQLNLDLGISDDEDGDAAGGGPAEKISSTLGGASTAVGGISRPGPSTTARPKLQALDFSGLGLDDTDDEDSSEDESESGSEAGSDSGSDGSSEYSGSESGSGSGSDSGSESGSDTSGSEGSEDEDDSGADEILRNLEKELGIDLSPATFSKNRRIPDNLPEVPSRGRNRITDLTAEQEKRRHIENVIGGLRETTQTSFTGQREREQDLKASKLEQIAQLRMVLEEDGIDCATVTNPTSVSSMDEIDGVLNLLRLRNDRNRCATLAEEGILGAANILESVFDGTREIPIVGWRPDYTGYHNTVMVKLHRMRVQTAQLVGEIIEQYNIGAGMRIALELLPSLLLYPAQQRRQKGQRGLRRDPAIVGGGRVGDTRRALATIRSRDEVDARVAAPPASRATDRQNLRNERDAVLAI